MPVLAAGTIALAGGFAREGHWPSDGGKAVIGTIGLVIAVSAASRTRIAPVTNALAWLVLLGVVYATVPALAKERAQVKKKKQATPKNKGK